MCRTFPLPNAFTVRRNTETEQVNAALTEWAVAGGLLPDADAVDRFRAVGFGRLAGYVYPDVDDLFPYATWLAWLFLLDDEFDEDRFAGSRADAVSLAHGFHRVLSARPGPVDRSAPHRLTVALSQMWDRLGQGMSRPLRRRFAAHVRSYALTYAEDIAWRRFGTPPSLPDYIAFRRRSGAVETCLDLTERSLGTRLPARVGTGPELTRLRTAANDVICWTNDLLSARRELAFGETSNLLAVLRHANGEDWVATERTARRMIAARTDDVRRLAAELRRPAGHRWTGRTALATARFVTGIEDWIAGSQHWHQTSARYSPMPPPHVGDSDEPIGIAQPASGGIRNAVST